MALTIVPGTPALPAPLAPIIELRLRQCLRVLGRFQVSMKRCRRDVLAMRPCDRTELNADTVEVLGIAKFLKDTEIEIRLHVKNAMTAVTQADINAIVFQRFDGNNIPMRVTPHKGSVL